MGALRCKKHNCIKLVGIGCTKCVKTYEKQVKQTKADGTCAHHKGVQIVPGLTICYTCQEKSVIRTKKQKEIVVAAYGGKCVCCDETQIKFLTIDHINNNGTEHRKKIGVLKGGTPMLDWLIKNNFPRDNFQLLCFNCNCGGKKQGICPHQLAKIQYDAESYVDQ